jgi:O-antigen/teichoic acid export membrane protein
VSLEAAAEKVSRFLLDARSGRAVASFFLTARLAEIAYGQGQTVGNARWAGLAESYHSGWHDVFRQRLTELTRLTAILGGAVIVPLAGLTGPFVSLWVGPEHYASRSVVAFVVFNGVLRRFSAFGAGCHEGE